MWKYTVFSCATVGHCPRGGNELPNWSVSDIPQTGRPKLRLFVDEIAKMGVFARFTLCIQPKLKLASPC